MQSKTARKTVSRIYTERKNRRAIIRLMSRQFESFSVQPIIGYYRGKREQSIVLEIVGASPAEVRELAARIRKMNGQKSVLTIQITAVAKTIRQ